MQTISFDPYFKLSQSDKDKIRFDTLVFQASLYSHTDLCKAAKIHRSKPIRDEILIKAIEKAIEEKESEWITDIEILPEESEENLRIEMALDDWKEERK